MKNIKVTFHPNGLRVIGALPLILQRKLNAQNYLCTIQDSFALVPYKQSKYNAIALYEWIMSQSSFVKALKSNLKAVRTEHEYREKLLKEAFTDVFMKAFNVDLEGIRKEPKATDVCIGVRGFNQPKPTDAILSPRHRKQNEKYEK
jgi:hypothetical protein